MRAHAFFGREPVFTVDEFAAAHPGSAAAAAKLLEYHARVGHVASLRRGVWLVVPGGAKAGAVVPDPYLVAPRLFEGGALSHAAALALHLGRPAPKRLTVVTPSRGKPFRLHDVAYVPVLPARALCAEDPPHGLVRVPHDGGTVRVTTVERTIVDLLETPRHGGGWRRAWNDLDGVGPVDASAVAESALLRRSPGLAARVGFWLERRRGRQPIAADALASLEKAASQHPVRLDRDATGRLVGRWHLVVPEELLRAPATNAPGTAEQSMLSRAARALLEELERQPKTADELGATAGIPPSATLAALLELELASRCERRNGGFVRVTDVDD